MVECRDSQPFIPRRHKVMFSQKLSITDSNTNTNRAMHLDGIRGVAALAVALFHFARSFDNSLINSNAINQTFISTIWNGHFAVALFFVLSGFLFFEKFYCTTISSAVTASIKRYLRLCIPILSICLAAYAIHKSGLYFNKEAGIASDSNWLKRWYDFQPDIYLAIKESFWSDFVSFDANHTYNSNLWTISYELFAVLLVIAFGFLCNYISTSFQIVTLVLAAALSFGTHYFEFILGATLALACLRWRICLSPTVAVFVAALALSIAPMVLPSQVASLAMDLLYPVAAVLFIGSVNASTVLRKTFSNRIFVKLGELSFGLYLTHFIVLNSAASKVFIQTNSITQTFIAYVLITAATTLIFTYAVDKPWMKFLNAAFSKKKSKTVNVAAG